MSQSAPARQLRAVFERYQEETWALFPQDASDLGLHAYDALLGPNDAAAWNAHGRLLTETLQAVEALPDDGFTGDDWLDRRTFLARLRTDSLWNGPLQTWRTNPQVHCDTALHSLFHLVIRNTDRLARIRPAIESRLAQLPRFLAEGAACLRRPVPLWTRLAKQSCAHAGGFLEELAAQLAPLSPTPEKTWELAREATRAFDRYGRAAENKTPGAASGLSVGRAHFETLIREKTGLPYALPEVQALGRALVEKLGAELAREARKFGRKKAGQILEEAAARWTPQSGSLLEEYRRITTDVRGRFEQAGLVTFPREEQCRVLPVPAFLRHHFPTAAYSQPGAFDRNQTGIFWVNDLGAAQTDPARRRAEIRQHFGIEFTCAHEAYPGHHLQFVLQNRHPSRIRRLANHAIFYEGWTLWCEQMSVSHGIVELEEARLIQLHDALWRAHRIGIDCGLHGGGLSYQGACRQLQEGVGFTKARAQGDVNWYTSAPTVPMSYLLGRLEVERLHAQCVTREGWSLRQFNDWILSFGAIPWRWIWESRLRP